jgi:hypothetical protein
MSDYEYNGYGDEDGFEDEYDGYGDEGNERYESGEDYPEDYEFHEDEDRVVANMRMIEQQGIARAGFDEGQLGTVIESGRLGELQKYRSKIIAGPVEMVIAQVEEMLRTKLSNIKLNDSNKRQLFTQIRGMKQLQYRNPATILLGYISHLGVVPDDVLQGYLTQLSKGVTYDRVIAYRRYWDIVTS